MVDMPRDGDLNTGRVTRRKRDAENQPLGKKYSNPLLNAREYEVEYPDGSTETYTTNMISENLYSQIDTEGKQYQIVYKDIDHRTKGHAIFVGDAFITDKSATNIKER
jgi:hypothetical protein